MKRFLGPGVLAVAALTLAACADDRVVETPTCEEDPRLDAERDGEAGWVEARAACLFECPLEGPWASGAMADVTFRAKDESGGALSVESSNADVLVVEELSADDDYTCGSRVAVRVTATGPGDAHLIVRRDGETLDTMSFAVRQPTSLILDGRSSVGPAGAGLLCAEPGWGSLLVATLFDASGTPLSYPTPDWAWEVDGVPEDASGSMLLPGPRGIGLHEVRVRWGELESSLTVNVFPSGIAAVSGFVCTAEAVAE